MSDDDRIRWNERYADDAPTPAADVALPTVFQQFSDAFPTAGYALELACGRGTAAVWLARRGMDVVGLDVSPVAVAAASELARTTGVAQRCRFDVADLDHGLTPGPQADILLCNRFRDPHLYRPMIERLSAHGLLAINVLSEVGASPGPFRAVAGELTLAFGELDILADGEGDGGAWLLGRRR